jgi:5-methylcytosine-specific restriction endonuclease McrA
MITKQCSTCKETKSITEFHKSKKEKDGYRSRCKNCRKLKEPYSAVKDYQDRYREANRTRIRAYFHDYNAQRAEAQAEYYASWRETNKTALEDYQREYYQRNATKKREYASRYAKENPEKMRVIWHRRRGRILGRGVFTRQEWEALKAKYNYTCLCCNKREPEIKLTPDHVIPLSRGGMNTIDNIQPLCRKCNNVKSARIKDYRK